MNNILFEGLNLVLFPICLAAVIASLVFNTFLLLRLKEYWADTTDENFSAVKKMQKISGLCSSVLIIWLTVTFKIVDGIIDSGLAFCCIICVVAVIFNAVCLAKYKKAKNNHNADVMKRAKGDPTIIFSDEIDLDEQERAVISQIALNAGVIPEGREYKSDEELFAVIDDPVYSPFEERGETICPVCGKGNKKNYTVCAYCGNFLPRPDINNSTNNL